jgi:hypothetical protein
LETPSHTALEPVRSSGDDRVLKLEAGQTIGDTQGQVQRAVANANSLPCAE